MLSSFELRSLRIWLVAITLFELPNFHEYLIKPNSRLNGFFSTLRSAPAEKRAWCIVLALLCLSRIQAAAYPTSPGTLTHNAAVHVLEAVALGYEFLYKQSNGSWSIFSVIVFNAVWFSSAAYRI